MSCRQDYQFLIFSLAPGSYIHRSWLKSMLIDEVFSWDFGAVKKEKLLSEFLMDQGGLKSIDFESFSQEEKQFFISSSKKNKLIVCYLGMFLCQSLLKSHILKKQVMTIKSNFGEDAYLFGLKKAPYLLKTRDIVFPDNKSCLDARGEIIAYGMACLQAYLSRYADDVKRRVLWKLPNHWQANNYDISSDNARCLINTVIQELK